MSGGPDRWGYTFPTSPSAQHLLSCSSNRCQSLTSSSTHPNARRHTPKSANQTANSCPKSHPCCSNCLNHTLHQSVPLSCSTMVTIRVCLVWVPSYAMPIFWSLTKIWHLFGWLPTISQPILVQLFGQSWPTHGLTKPHQLFGQTNFWQGKFGLKPNIPLPQDLRLPQLWLSDGIQEYLFLENQIEGERTWGRCDVCAQGAGDSYVHGRMTLPLLAQRATAARIWMQDHGLHQQKDGSQTPSYHILLGGRRG